MTTSTTKTGRKPNAKFMAPLQPDVQLAVIVGDAPLPRTQIVKRLWDHIKSHDLQDAEHRRTIHLDNALRPLFPGKSQISMFEVAKAIKAHTKPAEG